jgi:prolyl-tRNA synthetase
MKGVPVRVELGPRDVANGTAVMVPRDTLEKSTIALDEVVAKVGAEMGNILGRLRAKSFADASARVTDCTTLEQVVEAVRTKVLCAHSRTGTY